MLEFWMSYIKNTMVHFKIGQIKSTKARYITYLFMRYSLLSFTTEHPIPLDYVKKVINNKDETDCFKLLKTRNDFITAPNIEKYLMNEVQIMVKCGGVGMLYYFCYKNVTILLQYYIIFCYKNI